MPLSLELKGPLLNTVALSESSSSRPQTAQMNSQYLEIWLRCVKGLLYLHNPVSFSRSGRKRAENASTARCAICGCCRSRRGARNTTQRNATTSRNLDLAGLNAGRSSSAEGGGGGVGGLLFQRGSGTSVSSDLFIFIASPTLKSSQAHGSRHRLFFFFAWEEEQKGEVLPLISWCGTCTQTEPLILLTNSFSGFPIRLTACRFFFFFFFFWWLHVTSQVVEFGCHQKHWFIN